jgi:hypothetical protein
LNLFGLCNPALGAHTLPQAEQGPPVVVEILEFFAINTFGVLGAPILKQGCSQIETHRLRPIRRLIKIKRVLYADCFFERKNRVTVWRRQW